MRNFKACGVDGAESAVTAAAIQKFLTLIRKEPNSQNSALSCKDYRIYLYYKFDLIFQPITPFVGLTSQCSILAGGAGALAAVL